MAESTVADTPNATDQTPDAADTQTQSEQVEGTTVEQAELPEAADAGPANGAGQMDILLDTDLVVEVRLGEANVPVGELLQLGPGSVLPLERKVGEPMDLLLRGVPFAKGSLVVVGEQLGVRVQEILPYREPGEQP